MKALLSIGVVFIVIGAGVWYYVNRPSKGIDDQKVGYELSLDDLFEEFESNDADASIKYVEKVVVVSGNYYGLSGEENQGILLADAQNRMANCDFEKPLEKFEIKKGENITIKGVVVGYEDLLGEIQLKKCKILEAKQ